MPNKRASDQRLKPVSLSKDEEEQLNRVLKRYGQTFADWVRSMIARCDSERIPESQGDVKKIIPGEVARLAQEALEIQGQLYLSLAGRQTDQSERRRLRQAAAPFLDASAFFTDVLEERRYRAHILESGQRAPRHRRNSVASPDTESSSRTTDAPMG